LDALRTMQGRKNATDPIHEVTTDFAVVVILDQAFQAFMSDTSHSHAFE